jgi:hypothetical protein
MCEPYRTQLRLHVITNPAFIAHAIKPSPQTFSPNREELTESYLNSSAPSVEMNLLVHDMIISRTPPRVDRLYVVGRLTPSMKWKPRIHSAPLTREPDRAVALGRALVLT